MAEGKAVVACIVVGILGLLSTAVGVVFEVTPTAKLVHLFYFSEANYSCTSGNCVHACEYFRSSAFFLVVAAILCVLVAQIIISISTDCGCCRTIYSSPALQAFAVFAFFFSWLACTIAIILYAVGGAKQYGVEFPETGHLLYSNYWQNISVDNTRCYKVKHGTFAGAAAASFGALLLGILSYLPLISERRRRRRRFHARGTSTDSHSHDI